MAKKGKKYSEALKLVDRSKSYDSKEAIELVKKAYLQLSSMKQLKLLSVWVSTQES